MCPLRELSEMMLKRNQVLHKHYLLHKQRRIISKKSCCVHCIFYAEEYLESCIKTYHFVNLCDFHVKSSLTAILWQRALLKLYKRFSTIVFCVTLNKATILIWTFTFYTMCNRKFVVELKGLLERPTVFLHIDHHHTWG